MLSTQLLLDKVKSTAHLIHVIGSIEPSTQLAGNKLFELQALFTVSITNPILHLTQINPVPILWP